MADLSVSRELLEFKACKTCLQEKPLKDFDFEPRVKSKTAAKCSDCRRAYHAVWAKDHPDRIAVSRATYVDKYPERIATARAFTERRRVLELREKNLSNGLRSEPVITADGQRCPKCRRRKPLDEIGSNGWCKPCSAADARKRLCSLNPEQRERRRRWFRKYDTERLYGVPFEQLLGRLADQGGVCKICGDEIDLLARRSGCVDHCHSTSKIRGILCVRCNAGLGQFRDNAAFLAAAITYLTEKD